jgi:hypothetical protein
MSRCIRLVANVRVCIIIVEAVFSLLNMLILTIPDFTRDHLTIFLSSSLDCLNNGFLEEDSKASSQGPRYQ